MIIQSWGIKLTSVTALLLAILLAIFFISTKVFAATSVETKFVNHIQANLPEQDVFVESQDDATKVVRVEGDQAQDPTTLAKKVFAAAEAVAHDPFKLGPNPLGPYAKGASLGFTLGDWLAASGSGTYTVDVDTAQLDLSFQKLVPNGVYTVWCSRLTFPPNPQVVDKPCGAEDGSQNSFTADAEGNGQFKLTMKPLEESTKETASLFALAYHSDGKTYGVNTGDFGFNSHVHIFFLIPPAQAAESPAPVATPAPGVFGGLSSQAWLLIIGGVVVVVLGWWWFSKKTPGSPTPEA